MKVNMPRFSLMSVSVFIYFSREKFVSDFDSSKFSEVHPKSIEYFSAYFNECERSVKGSKNVIRSSLYVCSHLLILGSP